MLSTKERLFNNFGVVIFYCLNKRSVYNFWLIGIISGNLPSFALENWLEASLFTCMDIQWMGQKNKFSWNIRSSMVGKSSVNDSLFLTLGFVKCCIQWVQRDFFCLVYRKSSAEIHNPLRQCQTVCKTKHSCCGFLGSHFIR